MQGFIVARLANRAPLDAREIDGVERELKDLAACGGQQLLLDFEGISGTSSRLVAILVKAHHAFKVAGGRLKLCGLCRELASALASTETGQILEIMADELASPTGVSQPANELCRPSIAAQEEKVFPTADGRLCHAQLTTPESACRTDPPRNGLVRFREGEPPGEPGSAAARTEPRPPRIAKSDLAHAAPFDETVCCWLAPAEESTADSHSLAEEKKFGPPARLEAALRDRSLRHRFLLDVLVLDPRPRRLVSDPVMKPIRRVLAAVREQRASLRVVIDFNHVVSLSAEAAASLADQAIQLAVAGGTLRLTQVRPAVMETVRQSRLGRVTKVFPTVDEAVVAQWD
jgi:anti-anti-sigma regulatory factor